MSNNNNRITIDVSGCATFFVAALSVLFIGLKLTDVIDWKWVWVLAPLWVYAGCIGIVVLVAIIGAVIVALSDK